MREGMAEEGRELRLVLAAAVPEGSAQMEDPAGPIQLLFQLCFLVLALAQDMQEEELEVTAVCPQLAQQGQQELRLQATAEIPAVELYLSPRTP